MDMDQSSLVCTTDVAVAVGSEGHAIDGVDVVPVFLKIEVDISVEPPEQSRTCPQDDPFLSILPSNNLCHSIFIGLAHCSAELALERAVVVEGVVHLDDGKGSHLIASLVEIEHIQRRVMLFKARLKDEVEIEPVLAGTFAESRRLLEGLIDVAVVSCNAHLTYLIHRLQDVFLRTLVALVVRSLSTVQKLLRRKCHSLTLIERDSIGHHLGQLFCPGIAGTNALNRQSVISELDDRCLDTHVKLSGNSQHEGHCRQQGNQSLHLDIYSTTIIKSLGSRRKRHLRQLNLRHFYQGRLGRHCQRVDTALRQWDISNWLMTEGLFSDYGCVEDQGRHLANGTWLIFSQQAFCKPTVLLPLRVLLHSILHPDLPPREELPVHLRHSRIRTIEVIVTNESMTLTAAVLGIACDLGTNNHSKVAEGFIEKFLIDLWIEIANEYVCAYILGAFILGGLVDLDGFSIELDHMHDLDGVVGVLLALELDKTVSLMLVRDLVSRDVDIHHRTALREQLPKNVLVHLLVDVARVHRRLLVTLIERGDQRH